jgi:hypothetical protein
MEGKRAPPEELTSNQKGAIAEVEITCAAIRAGIDVYKPVAEHGRYDLIFGIEEALLRVQCKWANKVGDVVVLRLQSSRRMRDGIRSRSYTEDEIDAVAAYCPDLDTCYLLPAPMVTQRRALHLRLAACKNQQKARLIWAKDYELGAIAQLGERHAGSVEVVGSSPTSST